MCAFEMAAIYINDIIPMGFLMLRDIKSNDKFLKNIIKAVAHAIMPN